MQHQSNPVGFQNLPGLRLRNYDYGKDPPPELPILHDFALFLNFLRSHEKTPVTSTSHFLKPADLDRLNEELHFKANWVNPRSQQRHYPILEFFYHVVLTSHLARLYHDKKGSYLAVVPEKLEKYDLLTPTEKYFFLLETFWCRLNWESLNDNYYFPFTEEVLQLLHLVASGKIGQEFDTTARRLPIPGTNNFIYLNGSTQKYVQVFWYLGFFELHTDSSLTQKPDYYEFNYIKLPPANRAITWHLSCWSNGPWRYGTSRSSGTVKQISCTTTL